MLAMVDDIRGQRDRLVAELPVLGYRAYESWANFVLFDGLDDPHATFEALLARDIIIRDVGLPGALRVTAGTEQETTLFLEALAALGPRGAR
jgi:histidinol-phosphate aminotransferase